MFNSIDPSMCNYNIYSVPNEVYEIPRNNSTEKVLSTVNNKINSKVIIPPANPSIIINPKQNVKLINKSRIMERLSNKNQNNSIETSQLSLIEKNNNLNKKSNLTNNRFNPTYSRSKSVERLRTMARERQSNSKNSKNSKNKSISSIHSNDSQGMFSSVDLYLQRRHTQAQEKINKLKHEKMIREIEELKDRPEISRNSKMIVDRLITNKQNVFDRLTSNIDQRKRSEKLNKIEEINNKNTNRPMINETSEKLQRTIDDLYLWHKNLNEKKEIISQKINPPLSSMPKILKESEELLKEKHPDYLKYRVEDRLLERGLLY